MDQNRDPKTASLVLIPSSAKYPIFCLPHSHRIKDYSEGTIYKADYTFGSWQPSHRWPPCTNVRKVGPGGSTDGETQALKIEFAVDHKPYETAFPEINDEVNESVAAGMRDVGGGNMEWEPTEADCAGRRDFRSTRIFTIDPTSARDLDDALHVKALPDGKVEIGVHIADVSHFVSPGSLCDLEAQNRSTTVYLVDQVIPMLPRPLCEIACSLNENVDRLAFSCVWTMNSDGTMCADKGREVWFGKSVIRSCARLDYGIAQLCIEEKCGAKKGGNWEDEEDELWDPKRRPIKGGPYSCYDVAEDVRLMHLVASSRRALRYRNGALSLNKTKLMFRLDENQKPTMAEPYPIKDSNRLIEEYMLCANYLVAEHLIINCGELGVLRRHPEPLEKGLAEVVELAKVIGVGIDASSSSALQESLNRFGRECDDDLKMQAITSLLNNPMQPAQYFAKGAFESEDMWEHFALHIPYYTHFTSPIRRYADLMVHRLLQASVGRSEGTDFVFHQDLETVHKICDKCNQMTMASKKAQERSDVIWLCELLKDRPIERILAVVVSMGEKSFTVLVPGMGLEGRIYLEEQTEELSYEYNEGEKMIKITPKGGVCVEKGWDDVLKIRLFEKVDVRIGPNGRVPIDVKVRLNGPWKE